MESLVQVQKNGHLCTIQIDRPKALNALSYDLITQLKLALENAFEDSAIKHIWLESTSEKAFCAGGDVKALAIELQNTPQADRQEQAYTYFEHEFDLDLLIEQSPKPVVAFSQGFTFGGGWGLFAGANLKLCSQQASFAMPEVLIGYYPDVGAAAYLQADYWKAGTFVGMSSITLSATEAMALSYVDDIITEEYAQILKRQLMEGIDVTELDIESSAESVNETHKAWMSAMELLPDDASLTDWINVVEDNQQISPFSRAKKVWDAGSAWSVAFIWEYMKDMRGKSRDDILQIDKVAASNLACQPDFMEGIDAKLIDKSRAPEWQYPQVESVPLAEIQKIYQLS
ncbi:enoyl-CoA hydratase/isomerase family protein [Reinekea marinisedimentorum]|uniref:3-hydroxyisobutyryl-CoA hydrolase n=1 Tax=Reinekea marinisedimentorum TaxID=230495 RepID=A0A4R3I7A1_9GAMM|nr:enoyl-CoA hydratase/isomerase family protein [Reinekea marinisedimentorum]TCS41907.1 enoyl-CoA hydratase/carnithine racemase [Reinekea marinisedimentorum]